MVQSRIVDAKKATLYIFSGLPGSGKTAIAARAAARLGAVFIRIDTIDHGLAQLCSFRAQGEGYRLAYRIAADNLRLGIDAIADCVNPWELTRREWEAVATDSGAAFVNIEVVCSDKGEHRRRVEGRVSDIEGFKLPTWQEVVDRDYHAWEDERVVVETSGRRVEECVDELVRELTARRRGKQC